MFLPYVAAFRFVLDRFGVFIVDNVYILVSICTHKGE